MPEPAFKKAIAAASAAHVQQSPETNGNGSHPGVPQHAQHGPGQQNYGAPPGWQAPGWPPPPPPQQQGYWYPPPPGWGAPQPHHQQPYPTHQQHTPEHSAAAPREAHSAAAPQEAHSAAPREDQPSDDADRANPPA
jgi:cell division protease FtsH